MALDNTLISTLISNLLTFVKHCYKKPVYLTDSNKYINLFNSINTQFNTQLYKTLNNDDAYLFNPDNDINSFAFFTRTNINKIIRNIIQSDKELQQIYRIIHNLLNRNPVDVDVIQCSQDDVDYVLEFLSKIFDSWIKRTPTDDLINTINLLKQEKPEEYSIRYNLLEEKVLLANTKLELKKMLQQSEEIANSINKNKVSIEQHEENITNKITEFETQQENLQELVYEELAKQYDEESKEYSKISKWYLGFAIGIISILILMYGYIFFGLSISINSDINKNINYSFIATIVLFFICVMYKKYSYKINPNFKKYIDGIILLLITLITISVAIYIISIINFSTNIVDTNNKNTSITAFIPLIPISLLAGYLIFLFISRSNLNAGLSREYKDIAVKMLSAKKVLEHFDIKEDSKIREDLIKEYLAVQPNPRNSKKISVKDIIELLKLTKNNQ